jgi:importin-5
MVPLLKFLFHDEVKVAAVHSLPDLLNSARLAAEKGVPGAPDMGWVKGIMDYMWTPLLEVMGKESEPEMLREMMETAKVIT